MYQLVKKFWVVCLTLGSRSETSRTICRRCTTRNNSQKKHQAFDELSTSSEILEQVSKSYRPLPLDLKGGKVGLFGGAVVGKTAASKNRFTTLPKNTAVFQYLPVLGNVLVKGTTFTGNERIRRYRKNSHGLWSNE